MGYNCYRQEHRDIYNREVENFNYILFSLYFLNPTKWEISLLTEINMLNIYGNEDTRMKLIGLERD